MRLAWHDGTWGIVGTAILLAGILVLAAGRRFWPAKSWRWWMAGWVLPLGAAGCVCLAAAQVECVLRRSAPVMILLDMSPSTRGSPWRNPEFVRRLAAKRLGPGTWVTVDAFGRPGAAPRVLVDHVSPGDVSTWPSAWPSNILDQLDSPALQSPGDASRPAEKELAGQAFAQWVMTDGLLDQAGGLPSNDGNPRVWTVIPPASIDIGVRDVTAKSTLGGVEVLAQVRVVGRSSGTSATAVRVAFLRDDQQIASQTVAFHAENGSALDSTRWISVGDALSEQERMHPHRYTVVAHLLSEDGHEMRDAWPENDLGGCVWPAAPMAAPRILFVGNAAPATSFGATEYIPVDRFFGDVRRWTAEGWQAIVLDDVPAELLDGRAPLSVDAAQALRQFVEKTGGGLVLLGQGHAFGPGHYGETGQGSAGEILEQLSPVSSHFHSDPQRVIYVLDASASMNEAVPLGDGGTAATQPGGQGGTARKFAFLSRAVEKSATWLQADDLVSVITFNSQAQQVFAGPVGPANERAALLESILRTVHPSGPTVPDAALPLIQESLGKDRLRQPDLESSHCLVIFVTDGEIPAMDITGWSSAIRSAHANLIIVAPPSDSQGGPLRQLLENLSQSDSGRWIAAGDPQSWADVLSHLLAERFRGKVEQLPLEYEIATEAGEKLIGHPTHITRVWPKEEAEVELRGRAIVGGASTEASLFAWAQRGLGRVGAVAVENDASPAYFAAFRQLLQTVAANPGDRRFQLNATRNGNGRWLLTADGINPAAASENSDRFIDGESLIATPLGTDSLMEFPLRQTAPGHYQAGISAPGGLSIVVSRKDGKGIATLVGRLDTADVQTDEWPASVTPVHTQLAPSLSASLDDPATWHPTTHATTPLATPLWIAALIAALGALFLRR